MCDMMASSSAMDTPWPASFVISEETPFLGETEGPDREALLGLDLLWKNIHLNTIVDDFEEKNKNSLLK